jgi:hypothetical protein
VSTIGYLLILVAVFVISAALNGRVTHLQEDVSDAFLAIVRGDTDQLGEVLTRKGDDISADVADQVPYQNAGASVGDLGSYVGNKLSIAAAALKRGSAAKGYRWTATGPDYYDCSGLMWRACQDVGAYDGPRFTTSTIGALSAFKKVSDPTVNDLVVWPTHHMGVVTGNGQFYSARSVKSGIGYAKIDGFRKGSTPVYYRPASQDK